MKAERETVSQPERTRHRGAPAGERTIDSLDRAARDVAHAVGNSAFSHLLRSGGIAPPGPTHARRGDAGRGGAQLLRQDHPDGGGTATVPQDPAAGPGTTASGGAPGTTTASGAAGTTDWEQTPNLHGRPPVRERHTPPNTAVVEDESIYRALLGQAQGALVRQRARADALIDPRTHDITDFRWFFAKVYSHVTENEIRFCEEGAYYYPSYVLRCVLYFDQIYDDNFRAFDAGGPVEAHWRRAFQQCQSSQQAVRDAQELMMHPSFGDDDGSGAATNLLVQEVMQAGEALTISMKAHIRYDLPRAEAWVFASDYAGMPGTRQQDFQSDFFSMSGVFDQAARDFAPEMAHAIGVPTDLVPQLMQDTSMRYIFSADMATERADTWARATALGSSGGAGPYHEDPTTHGIQGSGNVVAGADGQGNLAAIGSLSDPSLRPSMDAPMHSGDDDDAHTALDPLPPGGIGALPAVRRVQYLRSLFAGATIGNDETLILRILNESVTAGDLVTVLDGADAWDMMYALDLGNASTLRNLFRDHYYAQTAQVTAMRLIYKCMDGETAEWEEHMISDLIVKRADRRAIVAELGRHYRPGSGDDVRAGVEQLDSELVGEDEDLAHRALGLTETSWKHGFGLW